MARETKSDRAERLRAEADAIEAAELKAERMKTAGNVPTCPDCGGRSFKISAFTIVTQSINFVEDADETDDADSCEWGEDYESGDHTDINESAECNGCGADVEDVLRKFGWKFYDDPAERTEDLDGETCDECKAFIPATEKETVNAAHAPSCSLFDEEATTTCGDCGDVYKIIDSDAENQMGFCSQECERHDAQAMRSRGEA